MPHANMNTTLTDAQKIKALNTDDVFSIMQKLLLRENKIDSGKAHFWIIGLASNHKILFIELLSMDGMQSTLIEPISVFRVAILKNAARVILVHNHPSGDIAPSEADKDITDRLMQVGRLIDVTVIDHLIISTENFYSFVSAGLYAELQGSTKWMPQFEAAEKIKAEQQNVKQEAVDVAKEAGLQAELSGEENRIIQMARALKRSGIEPKIIANMAGLPLSDIEKL